MVTLTPPLILEAAASPERGEREQQDQTRCRQEVPPPWHVPVHGNRVWSGCGSFGLDAPVVVAGRNRRQIRIVGPTPFTPRTVGILAVVKTDLPSEIVGRPSVLVDESHTEVYPVVMYVGRCAYHDVGSPSVQFENVVHSRLFHFGRVEWETRLIDKS